MFHGAVGAPSIPCSSDGGAHPSSNGPERNATFRADPKTEYHVHDFAQEDGGVHAWWTSAGQIPGAILEPGPQGVAEAAEKTHTAFAQVPACVARELSAAAPSMTSMTPPELFILPSSVPISTAPSGSLSNPKSTHNRVQFFGVHGRVPGEVPATPATRNVSGLNETLGRSFGFSTFQAPSSPERPSRFASEAGTARRLQSGRQRALSTTTRHGPLCHLAPLELPQQVAKLRLEITLQHSTTIEKVSATELAAFAVGETPFVNGSETYRPTVKAIRGAPELRKGAFYVPSEFTDAAASGSREVVSGVLGHSRRQTQVLVQLFVLFPSLMRPPRWLRKDFTLVPRATVEIDWQLPRRTQFLLYCLRRLDHAQSQSLSVWASKRRFGVGERFTLYGAEGRAEPTDWPYVLILKFYERREGPGPKSKSMRQAPTSGGGIATPGCSGSGAVASTGGEIELSPSGCNVCGAASGYDTPSGLAGGISFGGGTTWTKGGNVRLDALYEVQQQLLLRAQSSDVSGPIPIPESGLITWDSVLDYTLAARDGAALRRLIDSHYLDHLLKSQGTVDRIEKVAIANNDPSLMMMLYDHTTIEMDLRVLAFLVHCWAIQPLTGRGAANANASSALFDAGYDDDVPEFFDAADNSGGTLAARIEEFLVKYVLQRRNPLSATAAILRAIDDEMALHEENRRIMRLASTRFHSFHLAMLKRLNRYADVRNIRLVERILQPADKPNTVNEVSSLQVAFDSRDLKFMTESLIELYVKVQWLGRELLALTSHEDPRALGATNPLLAYAVLKSMGFAGKGTMDPMVMAASRLWHLYVFTSTAFFESPRGRWAMHALFELAFLGLYQWQVMYPDWDIGSLRALHLVFLAFIMGNLLDMAQFVHYRYGSLGRIRRFMTDPWNALGLVVNGGLMVLTFLKLAQDFRAPGFPPYKSADTIHVCMATLAVFVWVRALGMAVPVYPSLGPLLNTVARMMEEVIAFLFPMLIVMTGFSTMMAAIYQDLTAEYSGFPEAMLQLFSSMLGNFDFTAFDNLTTVQQLYGIIVLVIFLIISAILLMNLLIAIITNRYRPQEVEAESQFKKAQIVSYYQTQVTRNLVCSPFCLCQLLLQTVPLLPSGRRNKLSGTARPVAVLGLVPLDGVVLPDDGSDRPTGVAEIPHLVFLLTLYPIIAFTCVMLFALYTPFAVVQFASKMYMRLVKEYGKRMEERRRKANVIHAKNQGGGSPERSKKDKQEKQPSPSHPGEATDVESGTAAVVAAAAPAAAAAAAAVAAGDGAADGAVARSSSTRNDKQYQRLKKELQAESQAADMRILHTLGYLVVSSVLTVVGLVFYVLVLMVLMLVGWASLYQWVAKLAFSLYNVLVRPYVDMVRARRRQRRVSPVAAAAAALDVASGVGTEAATASSGRGAVSVTGCGSGASTGGSALSALFGGGGGRGIGGGDASVAGGDVSDQLYYKQSKARIHWRHAILKVIAMKNERYLAQRDLLKALAASKFRPHMAGWNLRVDLRSSSQDIMESQMQDLEDDDDPWDDDELQRDAGDDDTMEGVILEKTENLTSMLKNAINSQQAAMATLMERLQQLTEEVATLRSSGGGNAAATSAASDGVVIDDDDIDGGGAGWRPPPPPTRPPSEWDLAAGMGLRSQEPSGANSDFVRLRIRQEPELPQPSPGSFKGHSPMKDMEPTPAAKGDGDGDGDGFTAATVTDGDGGAANGGGGAACEAAAAAAAAPAEVSPPLSPSGMTRMSRVRPKTAPPRRAKPTAVAADMTPGDNPTAATSVPPPPLKAFDENDMDPQIQQHHTTARPNAATSSLPPRYPKLPATADAGRTTAATPASGCRPPDESPSQVASTDGSPRRSSSAGDALRSLQQQMTLDQLLNSSSGPDVLLAAIGTMHEGHGGGGGGAGNDGANPAAKPTPKRHTQEPNPKMSPAPVAVAAAVAPTPSQPPPPPPPPSQQ